MANPPPRGPRAGGRSPGSGSRSPYGRGSRRNPPPGWRFQRPRDAREWARLLGRYAAILAIAIALIGGLGVAIAYNNTVLPDPNKDFTTNTSFLYYRDGKTKLGSLAVQNRQSIPYSQMPQSIKDAVISAENRTFWTDRGISPTGIARSLFVIMTGGDVQGGSTITQEYIKVFYLTQDRTITRKLRELLLAVKMAESTPKETILESYLNTIYFGRGAYGVQAAAQAYFLVDAPKLTVPQSAVLASVLNNPSLFDPSSGPEAPARLLERYRYVLDGMAELGAITETERQRYSIALPAFPNVPVGQRYGGPNGFLVKMVENELAANGFTEGQITGGGLSVVTTFDQNDQAAAIAAAQKYTKVAEANAKGQPPKQLHAAIASVEVGTGEVLAIYGGPDFVDNSRNWATTDRPAASTFKTYALIAGLRSGLNLQTQLNGNTFTPRGDKSAIRNEFGMQYGPVTLTQATTYSINTAFVDMTQQIKNGPTKVIQAAKDAGVAEGPGWDNNNRIPLGTAEVSPLDQATGYATLANEGTYVPSHVVREVKDAAGRTLYKAAATPKPTIELPIARDVNYALSTVVENGTGRAVSTLGRPVAGKTGTADVGGNIVSAWFVAYTRQVSTAVMYVAGDAGTGSLDVYKRKGDGAFFGGTYPAQTWTAYMQVATKGQKVLSFSGPAWVNGGSPSPTPLPTPTDSPATPAETTPVTPATPSQSKKSSPGQSGSATPTKTGTATSSATKTATSTASAPAAPIVSGSP